VSYACGASGTQQRP